ncbi:Electron transfer flavoprotein, alpha subunit [Candidatus Hydrogenisulfobacillus filiaventi]|uniref:Electron transfer flavoprotein, alpha subunit n=1 Tax=Candidatus Hydrogenisulfobacillus filiaventi TaxID=2707344 RepID=A0A6F8ZG90_9FIRM|nr:electron transfer flavoprotein subunit alpha/FixB family protein [Bacillota bacterium]CAB1128683.1 Electron transfer flavoprotein, alpha subunit [Candidatus Hydrogenisulfobacillus filiaventi]
MEPLMVMAELEGGRLSDPSRECLTKARQLAQALGSTVVAAAVGPEAAAALADADADEAVAITGPGTSAYSPSLWEAAARDLLERYRPAYVLMPNTTMGMDLGAALAAHSGRPALAYAVALEPEGQGLRATSQVYGGKLLAEVFLPPQGTVITVIPGSWAAQPPAVHPQVTELPAPAAAGIEVLRVIEPESGGDVDITRSDILVSVGRGIQGPENLELAEELAEVLGGAVSCSRPVVDAGWMPRSRQVGKSGKTVKPKLYLALGISGAPEHLQGMKDAELIVAVNQDAKAPIFDVAQYGATVDILELMPALTERLRGEAG